MKRKDIEQLNAIEPNCFETDREQQWYECGLAQGLQVADEEPKLKWHNISDNPKDLPEPNDSSDLEFCLSNECLVCQIKKINNNFDVEFEVEAGWYDFDEHYFVNSISQEEMDLVVAWCEMPKFQERWTCKFSNGKEACND